jgi:ATP-dependent DNA helicase 2 subunit 2
VWVYKKTAEEKFPTLKKYSDKAPPNDKFASHEVKVDYEYKSVVEPDKVVPPDQRIKGYLYGPQVIPVSNAEWEAVKFKPEKGVKLLGFTDRSSVPRYALTFSLVSESPSIVLWCLVCCCCCAFCIITSRDINARHDH